MNADETIENARMWAAVDWQTGVTEFWGRSLTRVRQWIIGRGGRDDLRVARWVDGQWIEPEPEPEPEPIRYPWLLVDRRGVQVGTAWEMETFARPVIESWDSLHPANAPHRLARIMEHTPGTIVVSLSDEDVALWANHRPDYPGTAIHRLTTACRDAFDEEATT